MNIRTPSITIDKEQPFKHCKLNRYKYAQALASVVSAYPDGFVLALNSKWGTGKTTFLKMWEAYLKNENYNTLYFNAWENDFTQDPLAAILAELKNLLGEESVYDFDNLVKKAGKLTKVIVPSLVKGIAARYIKIDDVANALKDVYEVGIDILKEEIENYSKKRDSLLSFRQELKCFLKSLNQDKPIVFIIDELDRCRPSYSVAVLECIKHFFEVDKIVFVLAIDKVQIGHAIRGVYGSEQLDSNQYLRRFFDLEYKLPDPDINQYCDYLYENYDLDSFISSHERRSVSSKLGNEEQDIKQTLRSLSIKMRLSLRQIEKVMIQLKVIIGFYKKNEPLYPDCIISLILLREYRSETFLRMQKRTIKYSDFIKDIYERLFSDIAEQRYFEYTIAAMVLMYVNYRNDNAGVESFFNKDQLPFEEERFESIQQIIIDNQRRGYLRGNELSIMLNRMELVRELN